MFPVGDFLRTRTTPYVNWTLIAINIAVFVYTVTLSSRPDALVAGFQTSEAERFFFNWGFVPACVAESLGFETSTNPQDLAAICPAGDREYLQIFSAMFVHAGWAHIIGNMLFLWIFGDNVEDRMGHIRYLLFYFLCGIAAAATQIFMAIDTIVPAVGASGAIAGILGAYLVLHPTAMVQVIILPLFFIPFFVPAALLIVIWFATQLFAGFAELGQATAGSGVAWWAHIGGFVAGAVLIWVFKRPKRRDRLLAGTY
ncbi:MAG: rhomboid family intramembrane serine protease [Dehalococcoidia bacterium]|nr:rhomboid family intramembrane serine protease [Dehalococcoidia bacterium]